VEGKVKRKLILAAGAAALVAAGVTVAIAKPFALGLGSIAVADTMHVCKTTRDTDSWTRALEDLQVGRSIDAVGFVDNRDCIIIPQGKRIVREDWTLDGRWLVRPEGQMERYWTAAHQW
jgi:hypothetical protein